MDVHELSFFAQDDAHQFSEFDVSDTCLLEKHSSLPLDTLLTPGCQLESASSEQFTYIESIRSDEQRKVANRLAAKKYRMKQQSTMHAMYDKVDVLKQNNAALEQQLQKNKARIEDLENTIRQLRGDS